MNMQMTGTALVLVASLGFSGCATITTGEMQKVALSTQTSDGTPVEQAKCTLSNDKGRWEAESPGFASVHRSADDLLVECEKPGYASGFLRAVSRVGAGMFGNILIGGGIGAIIDHTKGTAYNYPDALPVQMGQSTTIDRNHKGKKAVAARVEATEAAKAN